MKTTVEIPDDLLRQVKSRAALDGLPLKAYLIHGLQLALQTPPGKFEHAPNRANFPLIHSTSGTDLVTDTDVAAALDEMENEEALHYAGFVRH